MPAFEELGGDARIPYIEAIKAQGAAARVSNSHMAPIHDLFPTEEGVCFATDFYENGSLRNKIRLNQPNHRVLQNVIGGILHGLSCLRSVAHRGHGSLHTDNVMLGGGPGTPLRECPVFLTDVAPITAQSPAEMETEDLHAVGQILYQLVMRKVEDRKEGFPFPVRSSPEWDGLGDKDGFWLRLCNRLLDPDLAPGAESPEALLREIGRPASRKPILIAAGLLLAAAAGIGVWLVIPRKTVILPPHLTIVSMTPSDGRVTNGQTMTWQFKLDHPGGPISAPQLHQELKPDADGLYTFATTPSLGAPAGRTNILISDGGALSTNLAFEIVPPPSPYLSMDSTIPGDRRVMIGQTMTWKFRVANTAGPISAPQLHIELKPDANGLYTLTNVPSPGTPTGRSYILISDGGTLSTNLAFEIVSPPPPYLAIVSMVPNDGRVIIGQTMTWKFRVANTAGTIVAPQLNQQLQPDANGVYTLANTPSPGALVGRTNILISDGGTLSTNLAFEIVSPPPPYLAIVSMVPSDGRVMIGQTMTWKFKVANTAGTIVAPQLNQQLRPDANGVYTLTNAPSPGTPTGRSYILISDGGTLSTNLAFEIVSRPASYLTVVSMVPSDGRVMVGQTMTWKFRVANTAGTIVAPQLNQQLQPDANGVYTLTNAPSPGAPVGRTSILISDGGTLSTNLAFEIVSRPASYLTIVSMVPSDGRVMVGQTMTWKFRVANTAGTIVAPQLNQQLQPDANGVYTLANTPSPGAPVGRTSILISDGGTLSTNLAFEIVSRPASYLTIDSMVPSDRRVMIGQTMTWKFRVANTVGAISAPQLHIELKPDANGLYTLTNAPSPGTPTGRSYILISDGGTFSTNLAFEIVRPPPPALTVQSSNPANAEAGTLITWILSVDVGLFPERPDCSAKSSNPELIPDQSLTANLAPAGNGKYTLTVTAQSSKGTNGSGQIVIQANVPGSETATTNLAYHIVPVPLPELRLMNPLPLVLAADSNSIPLRFALSDGRVSAQELGFSVDLSPRNILDQSNQIDGSIRWVTLTRLPGTNGLVTIKAIVIAGDRTNSASYKLTVEAVKPPALVLAGSANTDLDVNAASEMALIPCSTPDSKQLHMEILGIKIMPANSPLLDTNGIKFEPGQAPDTNRGFIVLQPNRGYVGTATVTVRATAAGATPAQFAIGLTVGGDIHPPKIKLSADAMTLEQDQTNQIGVTVDDEYSPAGLSWEVLSPPQSFVSVKPDMPQRIVTLTGQAPGKATVAVRATARNGSNSTANLTVNVLPAEPPQFPIFPDSPVQYPKGLPVKIQIADNATPPGAIRLDFPGLSWEKTNWTRTTNVGANHVELTLNLSGPPEEDATGQTFEITATDLAGHAATKRLEFVFPPRSNLYTNDATGMVLAWVKGLPETTGAAWPVDGRSGGGWVGKYEVMQGQFAKVLGTNPSANQGDPNFPVENMSLAQASEFCDKLTAGDPNLRGWRYALPSEQQWLWFAGKQPPMNANGNFTNFANYQMSGFGKPIAVGSLESNRFGLYDVFGNVGELTGTRNPGNAKYQAYKGGSFRQTSPALAPEWPGYTDKPENNIGFRVVLVPVAGK